MEHKITHPQLVAALTKPGADILATITAEDCHLIHMSMGVCGEAAELLDAVLQKSIHSGQPMDLVNVVEEMGDIEFYLEGLRTGLDIVRDEMLGPDMLKNPIDRILVAVNPETYDPLSIIIGICVSAGELLDAIKKAVIYRKPVDIKNVKTQLWNMEFYMANLRNTLEISRNEILAANISKLSTRA